MWSIVATTVLFYGTNCAPALHASAVEPDGVILRTASFESVGRRICVDVYEPKQGGRRPAVVVLHGSSGVHGIISSTASRYARVLAEQGLNAFVVHYFDATGTVIAGRGAESEHYFTWAGAVRDAVTWLVKLPEVDASEVGILGHSLGAYLTVGVAASDPRVSRVVLFGGGLEPFLEARIQRMPPTLVFHGDKDEEVPLSDAAHLVDFLRVRQSEVELRILDGEGHTFSAAAVDEALTEAVRFFTPQLRDKSGPWGRLPTGGEKR